MVENAKGGGGDKVLPSLTGSEYVAVDNGGPLPIRATTQAIADLGGGGGGASLLLESGSVSEKISDLPTADLTTDSVIPFAELGTTSKVGAASFINTGFGAYIQAYTVPDNSVFIALFGSLIAVAPPTAPNQVLTFDGNNILWM
jgi:hypothetical protein